MDTKNACDSHLVQEWKLVLMANVIFKTIWDDTETIVKIANKLIDETIIKENIKDDIEEEIKRCNKKIDENNNKIDKLLDMYLNETISKGTYINKKKDLESNVQILENKVKDLQSNLKILKDTLLTKMEKLKMIVTKSLSKKHILSDELIDNFVDKITVENDVFKWKLSYLNCIKEQENLNDVFLCLKLTFIKKC